MELNEAGSVNVPIMEKNIIEAMTLDLHVLVFVFCGGDLMEISIISNKLLCTPKCHDDNYHYPGVLNPAGWFFVE